MDCSVRETARFTDAAALNDLHRVTVCKFLMFLNFISVSYLLNPVLLINGFPSVVYACAERWPCTPVLRDGHVPSTPVLRDGYVRLCREMAVIVLRDGCGCVERWLWLGRKMAVVVPRDDCGCAEKWP